MEHGIYEGLELTDEQITEKRKKDWEEEMSRPKNKPLSECEEAFRRGYEHGFVNGRNTNNDNLSLREIGRWRRNYIVPDPKWPPGSCLERNENNPNFVNVGNYLKEKGVI